MGYVGKYDVERPGTQGGLQVGGRGDRANSVARFAKCRFEFRVRQRQARGALRKVQEDCGGARGVFRLKSNPSAEHHQLVAAGMKRNRALADGCGDYRDGKNGDASAKPPAEPYAKRGAPSTR